MEFRKQFEESKSETILEIQRSSTLLENYHERLEKERIADEEAEEVIIRKIYKRKDTGN